MPIEPVAYVAVAVCIFLLGFVTREIARWARLEAAFSRVTRGQLDEFAARFREETGRAFGVIEDFPEPPADRWWTGLRSAPVGDSDIEPIPDDDRDVDVDDDGYPPNLRVAAGAARLPFEPRVDEQQPALWPVNREPGAHRRVKPRGDDTRQFNPAEVLDAAGVGGAT